MPQAAWSSRTYALHTVPRVWPTHEVGHFFKTQLQFQVLTLYTVHTYMRCLMYSLVTRSQQAQLSNIYGVFKKSA